MKTLTLLTVDDEAHVHKGLDAIMDWQSLGYQHIGSALNGIEGLEIAKKKRPDVILTDIRMPGMDGLRLIEAVRTIPEYDPFVIIVTGYDEFEYARAALRHRVGEYILKPIDEAELARRLTQVRMDRTSERRPSESVMSGAAGFDNSAIRALLSAQPSDELLAVAREHLGATDGPFTCALLMSINHRSRSDDGNRVSIADVRKALAASAFRDSREWLYEEQPGVVAMLLRVDRKASGQDRLSVWAKGLFRALTDYLGPDLFLVVGPSVIGIDQAFTSRRTIISRMTQHHMVDTAGFAVLDGTQHLSDGLTGIAHPTEGILSAVERLDGDAAIVETRLAFEAFRRERTASGVLCDWLNDIRLQINRLVRELEGAEPDSGRVLAGIARQVEFVPLSYIESSVGALVAGAIDVLDERRRISRHGAVALMQRRINRRFAEEVTISAIAREYRMNANHLGQLFRKVTGRGFREALRERRIEEARRLLRDTDMRVPEVAAAVGYHDVDFFTSQFRRVNGTTPGAFRGSLRKDR